MEYQVPSDFDLKYKYDDWSNVGPTSRLRHQIIFAVLGQDDGTYIDMEVRAYDSWIRDMMKWCDVNIGKSKTLWQCTRLNHTFYFKNIEDAMAFKLRWS